KVSNDIVHRAVLLPREDAQRAVVLFPRRDTESRVEDFLRYVVGVGDEGNAHPRVNRLVLPDHVPRESKRAKAEYEKNRDGGQQRQSENQSPPRGSVHESTIAVVLATRFASRSFTKLLRSVRLRFSSYGWRRNYDESPGNF